jgi:hypothetical protein
MKSSPASEMPFGTVGDVRDCDGCPEADAVRVVGSAENDAITWNVRNNPNENTYRLLLLKTARQLRDL